MLTMTASSWRIPHSSDFISKKSLLSIATRAGMAVRLVHTDGRAATSGTPDPALVDQIAARTQPARLTARALLRFEIPIKWNYQRRVIFDR